MNKLTLVLLVLGMFAPVWQNAGAQAFPQVSLPTDNIDAYINEQMQVANLPGVALVIVEGDQITYLKAYGTAGNRLGDLTPQTPMTIGSLSKAYTALAIMQLTEAGLLELDMPVQRYLPWFTLADAQKSALITVRHLLNQTSGLTSNHGMQASPDEAANPLEERVRRMQNLVTIRQPGEAFEYSNANYIILGLLVETVSGLPYDVYLQQQVFTPLNMQHSYALSTAAEAGGLATGYRWWFGLPFPYHYQPTLDIVPAGFLAVSAEDMGHFLIANLNEGRYQDAQLVSPDGLTTLHTPGGPEGNPYAMGWAAVDADGVPVLVHEGSTPNFNTAMLLVPNSNLGIAILTNVSNMLTIQASPMIWGLYRLLLQPDQTLPQSTFGSTYLIIDLVLAVLTGLLILLFRRLPAWTSRLAANPPHNVKSTILRVGLPMVGDLLIPFILLVFVPAGAGFPMWDNLTLFQPDLAYWALGVAWAMVIKGLVRPILAFSVMHRTPPVS